MRIRNLGAFVNVSVSPHEVEEFKSRWPGSDLPVSKSITFTFDVESGDLVDVSTRYDGADLAALSQDAWAFYVQPRGVERIIT